MMTQVSVNWISVLVAAVASMVVGMVWYSKTMFGGMWMQLSGRTEKDMQKAKQKGIGKIMFAAFIAALVTSWVLGWLVHYMNAMSWVDGVQVGFWLWLGFIVTVSLGGVLFEKRPVTAFLISIGYQLVAVLIFGAVLAVWA